MIQSVVAWLEPWWPFVAKVLVLWFLGQFFKKRVWTKARAKVNQFHAVMRSTMMLHPFVGGIAWGAMYPMLPASAIVETRGGAINEGLLAAFAAVIGYRVLEFTAEYYVKKNPDSKWQIVLRVLREAVPANSIAPKDPNA